MPNRSPVVSAQDKVSLRLVGPKSLVWPGAPVSLPQYTVLSQGSMVARPLPAKNLPTSPDFCQGSWTLRLGDAGEAQAVFPNVQSSDGVPWRQRFDPTGHLMFLEVSFDGVTDFVGVIDQVAPSQQQVTVHAYDGWWLLKKAYERDWTVTMAPRDVIERGTQVWVPTTADNFPAASSSVSMTPSGSGASGTVTTPYAAYTASQITAASNHIAIAPAGGLVISGTGGSVAAISSPVAVPTGTQAWRASCIVTFSNPNGEIYLVAEESGTNQNYALSLTAYGVYATLTGGCSVANSPSGIGIGGGAWSSQTQIPTATSYGLTIESDGTWVWAFVNGQLVGCGRRCQTSTTSLAGGFLSFPSSASPVSATISNLLVEPLQPFLQRGSDKGDYVLPGGASTYPSGGLHARYFNDLDLQGDPNRLYKILAPSRTQAYSGSGTAEYNNRQDAAINGQANPAPGAASSNWSCVWFGAIYLKLSAGDYNLGLTLPTGGTSAYRVWIGKTQLGQEVAGNWGWNTAGSAVTFNVTAASLVGTLPNGAGTKARDGWYPIKIEFAVDSSAATAPALYLEGSPAAYTDPGGTAIAAGTQPAFTVFPSTSLSPLGCVDQRYQGISHFDLVQQTSQAFGYQATVAPQQLESGLFPGVLAPRIREGHDTDIILKPDRGPRQDGEGILNYSSTLDASDFAASIQGNGAGFQSGTTGQLQAQVYDPATLRASLFDAQAWQDFSDASFSSLLQALLNSQLGLQLSPWQLLSADPTGRPRKTFTWPLTGAIQNMRWRPGDGLRINAPDINVIDTSPRQMLVVTRNLAPYGILSTQATFANRPKSPAHTIKRQLYAATRQQRNYQRQRVTLTGSYIDNAAIAAGGTSTYSMVSLSPGDLLIGARLRINYNTAAMPLHVLVNGGDQTSNLNGGTGWTGAPVNLDLAAVATPDSNSRLYVELQNAGASSTTVSFQIYVDLLR